MITYVAVKNIVIKNALDQKSDRVEEAKITLLFNKSLYNRVK